MLQQVRVRDWTLNIDRESTIAVHKRLLNTWPDRCTCRYCENFAAAVHLLPKGLLQLCEVMGIDPNKATEVYEMGEGKEEGSRFYGGWYHLVGRIVEPHPVGEPLPDPYYKQPEGYDVNFSDRRLDLVPDGFPGPVLQLNFYCDVPWMLNVGPEE